MANNSLTIIQYEGEDAIQVAMKFITELHKPEQLSTDNTSRVVATRVVGFVPNDDEEPDDDDEEEEEDY